MGVKGKGKPELLDPQAGKVAVGLRSQFMGTVPVLRLCRATQLPPLNGLRMSRKTETFLPSLSEPLSSLSFTPPRPFHLLISNTHSDRGCATAWSPKHVLAFAHVSPSHQNAVLPCFSSRQTSPEKPSPVSPRRIQFSVLGAPKHPSRPFLSFQYLFHST